MSRRRHIAPLLVACAALLASGCIGDGCSGKLMGKNAARRMGLPFFKHALPPNTTLIKRAVAVGPEVYGVQANPGTCVLGARQTVSSALTRDALIDYYKRAYFKSLMRRLPRGLQVVVAPAGKPKAGRTRYTLTITDCCRNFGSVCQAKK
ncbi:MAG: hypothetical protein KC503_14295 [Myxococcales bacterium]|nr:hypothetical protein [Myxococcales bacterium]